MAYKLQAVETVRDGLRRCAREQLDRAIEELTTRAHEDPVEAVHDARKALKKARSLLRLSRGTIDSGERRRENAALRKAGRTLSAARDAEVKVQAVDELSQRFAGRLPDGPAPELIRFLRTRTRVRIDKAKRLLGYRPAFDFAAGMDLTERWARWASLLEGQPPEFRTALEMLRQGHTQREICETLGLNPKLIQRLLQRLSRKLETP